MTDSQARLKGTTELMERMIEKIVASICDNFEATTEKSCNLVSAAAKEAYVEVSQKYQNLDLVYSQLDDLTPK